VHEVTSDLGGPAELTETQRQIIRRIASMSVWCESEEAKMADGANIDIDKFQRTSNSLRRLCETIGLRRVARDVTPTLATVLNAHAAKSAEGVPGGPETAPVGSVSQATREFSISDSPSNGTPATHLADHPRQSAIDSSAEILEPIETRDVGTGLAKATGAEHA
jgi:hypothetical protein